jgi:hypothetical protein
VGYRKRRLASKVGKMLKHNAIKDLKKEGEEEEQKLVESEK